MPQYHAPKLSRRSFMATAAAAGLAAPGAMAATKPRIALIGCGIAGQRIAESLRSPDAPFRLEAIRDTDRRNLAIAAANNGAAQASDWPQVQAMDDIDAVIVATPDHTHAAIALAALKAGKHVYLLPPVALAAEDARRIHGTATENGVVVHVGMTAQQAGFWRDTARLLDARHGAPAWIQIDCRADARIGHWTRDRNRSWGPAARQVFEMLYPMQYHLGLGAPLSLSALGGSFTGGPGCTPDALSVTARYANGTTAVVSVNPAHSGGHHATIRGPWPTMELDFPAAALDFELTRFARAVRGPEAAESSRWRDAVALNDGLCRGIQRITATGAVA